MKEHYFVSETDGSLHDTREPNWSSNPLRVNFNRHCASINSVADLKATLRAGAYTWPGGYPLYFITSDGMALSFASLVWPQGLTPGTAVTHKEERLRSRINDIQNDSPERIIGCAINYEDTELYCDYTGDLIESAY